MSDQVAWFIWCRSNGRYYYYKRRVDMYPFSKEGVDQQVAKEVAKFPLDQEEWKRPLDELAKKYPMPVQEELPVVKEQISANQ